jgi:alternate signal-mediated exported protein
MKKTLLISLSIIILVMGLTTVGILAFFSDTDIPPTNHFTGGIVNITANETLIPGPWEIKDWTPGKPVNEDFIIKNTGTVPIFLRASFIGSWTPLTSVTGKHVNTATVTANYEGKTVTDSDKVNYYVTKP